MDVRLRDGGDGVTCWNADAILAYARDNQARQALLTQANPDLDVTPGRIRCYGCTALDYGHGIGCSAELTRPLYQVRGELGPHPADAAASLRLIPNFRGSISTDDPA